MERTLVGTITESERDEIQQINYRMETLKTVFRSLSSGESMSWSVDFQTCEVFLVD